jgi:hypothetical protein
MRPTSFATVAALVALLAACTGAGAGSGAGSSGSSAPAAAAKPSRDGERPQAASVEPCDQGRHGRAAPQAGLPGGLCKAGPLRDPQ